MERSSPLWEVTRALSATAMGSIPADLVIRNGRLVNVFTGEILPHTDVAVANGRIALVGDAGHCIGRQTEVVDAGGRYLVPGLLDGHIHVESSMLTVHEYAGAVLPHGTSAIFFDPHEIVNVTGLSGMRAMMEDAASGLLRVYATTPSCVPASPGLENTGSRVTPADIAETMEWPDVAGLGEMMDVFGVTGGSPEIHARIAATLRAGKPVTGHYPMPDLGSPLNAYAAAGVSSCHESTTAEQAIAKLRLGMYAMIREGSAWDDLPEVIRAVTERKIDTRRVLLISDDLHAETILSQGHMDRIVRLAISCGVSPVAAVQMATLNTAEYFGLAQDLGSIAPGRCADICLVSDLAGMTIDEVFIGGEHAASGGTLLSRPKPYAYPEFLKKTMKIGKPVKPEDFEVRVPAGLPYRGVRVIEVHGGNVLTSAKVAQLPVEDGVVKLPPEGDVLKAAVFNRHGLDSRFVGFVSGFSLQEGATASTYAHDAHNLLVIGTSDADMAAAANALIACGGGIVAVSGGKILKRLELPIAGLMSESSAQEVAKSLRELGQVWKKLGCPLPSPFMTMSLLSLSVIPEIRITDKGIVDVLQNRLVSLFVE